MPNKDISKLLESRQAAKAYKAKYGEACPGCVAKWPKRVPTKLVPGQVCKMCGHADTRAIPSDAPKNKQ